MWIIGLIVLIKKRITLIVSLSISYSKIMNKVIAEGISYINNLLKTLIPKPIHLHQLMIFSLAHMIIQKYSEPIRIVRWINR